MLTNFHVSCPGKRDNRVELSITAQEARTYSSRKTRRVAMGGGKHFENARASEPSPGGYRLITTDDARALQTTE